MSQSRAGSKSKASTSKKKVLIVDDHSIVREGLKRLIEAESDLIVCAEAEDGAKALDIAAKTKPDIAVTDIGLPGMSGLDLIKNLKTRLPTLPILAVSMYEESVYAERAIRAGAKGYLMKRESALKVIEAIRRILSGKLYLSEAVSESILDKVAGLNPSEGDVVQRLSDRELEVFQMIGKGHKTSEIADSLNLGVKTVESYKEQIKTKLNLESASALTQYAIEWSKNQNL